MNPTHRCPACKSVYTVPSVWMDKEIRCPRCGANYPATYETSLAAEAEAEERRKEAKRAAFYAMPERSDVLTALSTILIAVGVGAVIYFLFIYDTSVAIPGRAGDRVENLGKLNYRQTGATVGIGACILGAIFAFSQKQSR